MRRGPSLLAGLVSMAFLLSGVAAWAAPDVHAAGVDPLSASPVQREQAQSRFVRGKELFEASEFAAALVEFDASRAIVASPNAKLYRARCLLSLGKLVAAYSELGSTLVEAIELSKMEPRYARTARTASQERAELEAQLAFVRLNVLKPHADTAVNVNGEQLRRTAWAEPVPARAGVVDVVVSSPDRPLQQKRVSVAAGETRELVFDVAPSLPRAGTLQSSPSTSVTHLPPRSYQPYAYAAAGVGALGMGAFTVLGLMSNSTFDQLENDCQGGICTTMEAQTVDRGRSQQRWANVGLAIGVLGIGGAVTLFVLDEGEENEEKRVTVGLTLDRIVLSGKL